MRKWMLIAAAVLAALSCSREKEQDLPVEPEGKVEVLFTVTGSQLPTKALGEAHQLETMHIAVFGGSGYLKEYVPATLKSTGSYEYHYYDDSHQERVKTVPEFTYSVQITLSNSSRRVHFIGNGPASIPFGRDYEVLPALLGEKETGYWQMITLDNVTALQDADGNYLTPDGNGDYRIREQGEDYVPSDALKQAFSNVPLIRNWSKIVLHSKPAEQSNFTPVSFAVVNVPEKGALVPYGGVKGFITNYKDFNEKHYNEMMKALEPERPKRAGFNVISLHFSDLEQFKNNKLFSVLLDRSWCYINYLQVGTRILVPKLGYDLLDNEALKQIREAFSANELSYEIELISQDMTSIVEDVNDKKNSGGALNCLTWTIQS